MLYEERRLRGKAVLEGPGEAVGPQLWNPPRRGRHPKWKKRGKKKEEAKKRIDDGNNYPFGSHVLKRRVHLSVCLHVLLLCCNEPFVSLHSLFFYCFSPLPLIFIITA